MGRRLPVYSYTLPIVYVQYELIAPIAVNPLVPQIKTKQLAVCLYIGQRSTLIHGCMVLRSEPQAVHEHTPKHTNCRLMKYTYVDEGAYIIYSYYKRSIFLIDTSILR